MNEPNRSDDRIDLAMQLQEWLAAQRRAFDADRYPSITQRQHRIDRLIELVLEENDGLIEAMSQDFGNRCATHSLMVDAAGIASGMKKTRNHLRTWMQPERRSSGPLAFFGARARVEWQPLGVIGVISPWNFPVSLALIPTCQAFAAGNRVMLKLSEVTPRTSALLSKAIATRFDPTELVAVTGDAEVGAAFSRLCFDHLIFTGATAVGRHILHAAADHLVPVTLELGGKSPAVVAADANLAVAASRISIGKMLNAGQICLAPDYALVPLGREREFVEHFRIAMTRMLPTLRDNDDYTSIVSEHHLARLQSYLDDARQQGAQVIEINPANESLLGTRKIAPALILGATPQMKIMQEEIFGPLMPVIAYSGVKDAVRQVNAGPRPLGAYYFGADNADRQYFLQQTHSGGVTLNDIFHHVGNANLPFGGVGASGMGNYHGIDGFRTFSHGRAVQQVPLFSINFPLKPPFGERIRRLMLASRERELIAVRKRLGKVYGH